MYDVQRTDIIHNVHWLQTIHGMSSVYGTQCIQTMVTACGVQTEERQRAEAKRKAAEAAAEAKQEADIAAYHACLRDKEAHRHHQPSLGREDQPAGLLQGAIPGSWGA